MDIQSLYYIKKYNDLIEQINRLKYENSLLEDLTSGAISSSQRETTTGPSSTSTTGSTPQTPPDITPFNSDLNGDGVVDGVDLGIVLTGWNNPYDGANLGSILTQWGTNPGNPEEPSNPQNPPIQTPYNYNKLRGTSIKDIASLSNRNFVNNFGL